MLTQINYFKKYDEILCKNAQNSGSYSNELNIRGSYFDCEWGLNWTVNALNKTADVENKLNDQIDFTWFAFNFSLISKLIYNFSPQNYIFCLVYLNWKNGYGYLFKKVYKHKQMHLVDLNNLKISEALHHKFQIYSTENLETYLLNFIEALEILDENACFGKLDYKTLLKEIITKEDFTDNFSKNPDTLSFNYLELLSKKINLF